MSLASWYTDRHLAVLLPTINQDFYPSNTFFPLEAHFSYISEPGCVPEETWQKKAPASKLCYIFCYMKEKPCSAENTTKCQV